MRNLLFISIFAIGLTLIGCNSKKQSETTCETTCEVTECNTICGKWELTKINDNTITANEGEEQAYVIFNMQDSTVAAFDGCNNIGGWVVKADSGNLVMVDMASTLQFCPDQGESAMLGAILNVADKYEIKECSEQGKFLVITSTNDSISATFKAVEETK